METALNYTDKTMFFSSDERKWINKIRSLAEQNPDAVTILKQPEQNHGSIYAKLPAEYLKISAPIKRVMTDEQIQAAAERLKAIRERQNV